MMLPYILGYYLLCFVLFRVAFRIAPKPRNGVDAMLILIFSPLIVAWSLLRTPRFYFILAAMIIGVALLTGCDEYEQAVADSAEYCENVDIWRRSHGEHGHPAYRGINECGVIEK